jgi:hypothetical protein
VATEYDGIPSILDRVIGSDLIVIGRVRGPVRIVPLDGGDRPRVHGWFEVDAEETLAGEPSTILLRVVGNGSDADVTWPVPVPHRGPLLLMLTRDVGPELPENMYAPCFNGIYEVVDGTVTIPSDSVDEITGKAVRPTTTDGPVRELTMEGLRDVLETVRQRSQAVLRQLQEEEPAEVQQLPRPELDEYPRSDAEVSSAATLSGGGQPAEIDQVE